MDIDKSFDDMTALLQAIWPTISKIDWSYYCTKVSAYDDAGVPKYTGLLMHCEGRECVGASTIAVGFLPRPEKSAAIVTNKTSITADPMESIKASIQRRDPDSTIWGGGVLSSYNDEVAYAITGLPEIGDHLLIANMMCACDILRIDDFDDITDFEFVGVKESCDQVGMNDQSYTAIHVTISKIVDDAAEALGLLP